MSTPLPTLALVSIGIRRDLTSPLRYFTKFDLVHFYRHNRYGDLLPEDFDATLKHFSSPLDLYRQLVSARPAVIQGVEPFSFYTQPFLWAGYFAARKTNAALLVGTHENRPLDLKFGKTRAALLRAALRHYFARACVIIAHNDGAQDNVRACGGNDEKIVRGMWGNWGVDTCEFVPRPELVPSSEFMPRAARDPDLPPTILFAGRLQLEKGVFVLMDAFALVRQRLPNARLIMAGDGPARESLIAHARALELNAHVEWLGMVKHREMPRLYHAADVFCAPSLTTRKWAEQVGSASLQAMASGLPVVSTRSGAIPEYIPDGLGGILVNEGNSAELAEALIKLLADPERAREMGQHAREYACAHYDARTNVVRGEQLVMEHCLAHRL